MLEDHYTYLSPYTDRKCPMCKGFRYTSFSQNGPNSYVEYLVTHSVNDCLIQIVSKLEALEKANGNR